MSIVQQIITFMTCSIATSNLNLAFVSTPATINNDGKKYRLAEKSFLVANFKEQRQRICRNEKWITSPRDVSLVREFSVMFISFLLFSIC